MCATVCPSQALSFGTPRARSRGAAGGRSRSTSSSSATQTITTKVYMMVPPEEPVVAVDVADFLWEPERKEDHP